MKHDFTEKKSTNETLIAALHILSNDLQSEDGVANACCAEASLRIRELVDAVISARASIRLYLDRSHDPIQKRKLGDAIKALDGVL